VGISGETRTAEYGRLYSLVLIPEGTSFSVEFRGSAEALRLLRDFIQVACDDEVLRVGTNRTRGLGSLGLEWLGETEDAGGGSRPDADFAKRLSVFDERFRAFCARFGVDTPDSQYFAVTSLSDVILPDEKLRFVLRLEPRYLLGGLAGSARLVYHSGASRRVHGWSELWGMPKPDEIAIGMGSVFLYGCHDGPPPGFVESLWSLDERGLGRRLQEGFGRIAVSDSFHWEVGD
jgi:hypothetical protein